MCWFWFCTSACNYIKDWVDFSWRNFHLHYESLLTNTLIRVHSHLLSSSRCRCQVYDILSQCSLTLVVNCCRTSLLITMHCVVDCTKISGMHYRWNLPQAKCTHHLIVRPTCPLHVSSVVTHKETRFTGWRICCHGAVHTTTNK